MPKVESLRPEGLGPEPLSSSAGPFPKHTHRIDRCVPHFNPHISFTAHPRCFATRHSLNFWYGYNRMSLVWRTTHKVSPQT